MKTNYDKPTCLITGCLLMNMDGQRALWGDLHAFGDCLIFNSVGFWEDVNKFSHENKLIYIDGTTECFEKKGLLVMKIKGSALSSAAVSHIGDN